MSLKNYEIAILVKMYDEKIIGHAGYKAIQNVQNQINGMQIISKYDVKKSFKTITRKLVERNLLSDDGKSMKVLYLDKLGVSFVVGYLKQNPDALSDLNDKINGKKED